MGAGIPLSKGIYIEAGQPADAKYFKDTVPYATVGEVNATIPLLERNQGLTVNVAGVEYWYKEGTADGQLVIKQEESETVEVVDNVTSTDTDKALSAKQGKVLKAYIDAINGLLTSDDVALDELQELVDYIKVNKDTLDTLGIANIAGLTAALAGKVDKDGLKVLSDNNYDDAAKALVDGLTAALALKQDILVYEDISSAGTKTITNADNNKIFRLRSANIVFDLPDGLDDIIFGVRPLPSSDIGYTFGASYTTISENGVEFDAGEIHLVEVNGTEIIINS